MSIFIVDGYTCTKKIEAVRGLHPEVVVVYRPAVAKARIELGMISSSGSVDRVFQFENELLANHVIAVGDTKLTPTLAGQLVPALRGKLLDLVLGYAGSDEEEADVKN